MASYLAITWGQKTARALLANVTSGEIVIKKSAVCTVSSETENGTLETETLGSQLEKILASWDVHKLPVLVSVSRADLEIQPFTLPPCPMDELPEMVKFQAMRELASVAEGGVVDFLPLSGDTQTEHQVLAVALKKSAQKRITKLCEKLGTEPLWITPQVSGAIALLYPAGKKRAGASLLILPTESGAEIAVLSDERVLSIRSVRWSLDASETSFLDQIWSEIQRTKAAVYNLLAGQEINSIVLCDQANEINRQLVSALEERSGLKVSLSDVKEKSGFTYAEDTLKEGDLSRYASLLGLLQAVAQKNRPILDFVSPRKRPPVPSKRRQNLLIASVFGALLLGGTSLKYQQWHGLQTDITRLKTSIKNNKQTLLSFKPIQNRVAEIQTWQATNVQWLKEMNYLSYALRPSELTDLKYPRNEDVIVTKLEMKSNAARNGVGGILEFKTSVKELATVSKYEKRLRDKTHLVPPEKHIRGRDSRSKDFKITYSSKVIITPEED